MGIGSTVKSWWGSATKNKAISESLANGTLRSVLKWGAAGAAVGTAQGAARKVAGIEDNISVLGGTMSGFMAGAGARGAMWGAGKFFPKKMSKMASAAHAAANASGGGARSARAGAAYAAAARGRVKP
jgi:hypothetical protein